MDRVPYDAALHTYVLRNQTKPDYQYTNQKIQ